MSKKKLQLLIDADFLIFQVTEGKNVKMSMFGTEKGEVESDGYKEPLKPYKKKFKQLIKDIEDEVALALFPARKLKGKPKLLFSDPETNFRYDLLPNYKNTRSEYDRGPLFYRFRKWALKKYGYEKNLEADDLYGHYMSTGKYIGVSMDKDLNRGVAGTHFNPHYMHRCLIETGELEARNFRYLQAVMGDATDGIKGIPRCGEKTAIKLLDTHGWDWCGVVKAYEEKGLTENDALLTMRLVNMLQWDGKKLNLYKGENCG